ncbi:MAG TPA: helix-turn-helix domain-containing protein, partial [Nitrososphaeraceae archaeon]|nr:helix-turn-helix domain-containing protein [Nitrososphaeraceae archaeon]
DKWISENKEEYRRASAIKQKLEGLSYRTIARNLDVNYRNVYNWIKEYKEYGLNRAAEVQRVKEIIWENTNDILE